MSVDVTVCGASSSTSLLRRHIIMLIKICACYLGHKTKLTYHHNTPRSGFKPYIWINAVNAPAPSNILTRFFDGKSFSLYRFGSMEKENQRNQAKKRKKKRINERTNERRKKWEECNRRPTTKTSPVKCTQISFGFSLARTLAPPFISRQISHATFARSTLCSCSTSFCFSCESLSHCDMVSFFFSCTMARMPNVHRTGGTIFLISLSSVAINISRFSSDGRYSLGMFVLRAWRWTVNVNVFPFNFESGRHSITVINRRHSVLSWSSTRTHGIFPSTFSRQTPMAEIFVLLWMKHWTCLVSEQMRFKQFWSETWILFLSDIESTYK